MTGSSSLQTAVNAPLDPYDTRSTPISAATYLLTYPGADRFRQEAAPTTAARDGTAATAITQAESGPESAIDAIASFKPLLPTGAHFIQLGAWRGKVIEVNRAEFRATLQDQVAEVPEEVGTFQVGELSEDDLPLVAPGAEFYWVVGYQVNSARQRIRTSVLRMRRLPTYSGEEVDRAQKWAESKSHLFAENGTGST